MLADDLGRISIFGSGISPDTYSLAPDCQLLLQDWMEPVFDESRTPIDPIAQRPSFLVPPRLTCGLERTPNPVITTPEFFTTVVPEGWFESANQIRHEELVQSQLKSETKLFAKELAACPPGIAPKHSRSRKRRVLYGSDVEEVTQDNTNVFAPQGEQNIFEEVEDEPVEVEDRRTSQRVQSVQEDDDVYEPSLERLRRIRRRRTSTASSPRVEAVTPSEWLTIDDRRYSPYLPQLHDIVVYFPQGHRTFLDKEGREIFHEDLPSYVTQTGRRLMVSHVMAQVVGLEFFVLERPWCQLTLVPTGENSECSDLIVDEESSERFTIKYYDMEDIPDFLILACRYKWAEKQDYSVGQLVRVLYGYDEIYHGKIIRVGPRRRSVWQCFTVEWLTLTDPPEECSPWELEPLDDDEEFESYSSTESIHEGVLRTLLEGLRRIMDSPRAEFLIDPVDYRLFPDYLSTVPYPIYLDLMKRRLEHGFYRRLDSFLWDAKLIPVNALLYNEPDSAIVRDAEAVYSLIEALVKRAKRPSRHSNFPETSTNFQLQISPQRPSRKRPSQVLMSSSSSSDEASDNDGGGLNLRRSTRRRR